MERTFKIFEAIVDEYIRTGEPVGSKVVMERLGFPVSSATIRNEMAVLENQGYLDSPHTSAGRVPTVKGYRFYIERMMNDQPRTLSGSEKEEIDRFFNEISESGDGIHGHDIEFILLSPLTEESAVSYKFPVTPRTIAIFSFASDQVNRLLVDRAAAGGVPLLLAGGENVFFFKQGRIMPFVFALDLFRDYRCRAFADYALKTLTREARLGIMGPRFTLHEEREAKICFDLFSDEGFMPMPFWLDASVSDSFSMVEQEIKEYSDGVLISHVGGMASKEIWRGITVGYRSPYRIWYGGVPDNSFLSFNGMIFADQNIYLEERGGFEQLKRDLWTTRVMAVPDKVAAGRANALATWLTKGLSALPRVTGRINQEALFASLRTVSGIPFGKQTLDIDSDTHRPALRQVYILEVRGRSFFVRDTLGVHGLKYYDY